MAPNHGGEPLGSILVPVGSHWGQKMGQNRKKITMPHNKNFWLLRCHRFGQKIEFTVVQWGPIGAIKWVKTVKNYHAPKFQFLTTMGYRFGQKIEFTVMAPYHGGDPLGSILGPMGSHWGQKVGQNRQKLPCPQIRIFYYSAVIDLEKKWNSRLWRQITVGNP